MGDAEARNRVCLSNRVQLDRRRDVAVQPVQLRTERAVVVVRLGAALDGIEAGRPEGTLGGARRGQLRLATHMAAMRDAGPAAAVAEPFHRVLHPVQPGTEHVQQHEQDRGQVVARSSHGGAELRRGGAAHKPAAMREGGDPL